jgi:aldose 1-epimerase
MRVPTPSGEVVDVLRGPDSADQLRAAPARFGLPLLFPFPNRITGGRYTFRGQTYQLPVNSRGTAIHGLVLDQRFRVEAAESGDQGAHLRCVIAHADLPTTQGYPFPFRFVADYYLLGPTLTLTVSATNTGDQPMPFGFGIHPYFRTPIVERGSRDDCLITAPVGARWELSPELIPTGRRAPLTADDPLRALRPLAGRNYDDVYGDVAVTDGRSTCRLVDPAAGLAVALEADANFREMVVYAPPGLPAVCFEPYTCATDAFNLNERGIDAGRLELAAGQAWSATIRVDVGPA